MHACTGALGQKVLAKGKETNRAAGRRGIATTKERRGVSTTSVAAGRTTKGGQKENKYQTARPAAASCTVSTRVGIAGGGRGIGAIDGALCESSSHDGDAGDGHGGRAWIDINLHDSAHFEERERKRQRQDEAAWRVWVWVWVWGSSG